MLDVLRAATLVAATLATGLLAGLFYTFTVSVMPGLARADDRTFVTAMQKINIAIVNPWFLLTFLGAGALIVAALLLGAGTGGALPWIVAGLVLYGVMLAITFGINIPLNNALDAVGTPDQVADLARARAHFETSWVRWNLVRTLACTAAFACLVASLRT